MKIGDGETNVNDLPFFANLDTLNEQKMDAINPVGTGSFSVGRKTGSFVGDNSVAVGVNAIASGENSVAIGKEVVASRNGMIALGCYNLYDEPVGFYEATTAGHKFRGGASSACYASTNYVFDAETRTFSLVDASLTTFAEAWNNGLIYAQRANSLTTDSMYELKSVTESVVTYTRHYVADYGRYNGKYNVCVGNGKPSALSNSHTLDFQGNAWYQGDVYVGSTSGTNKDEGSKKLATEDKITELALPLPESAAVGQFIKVLEVDESGKVTATEAVDEPDENDALELVAELGLAEPMTDDEGNVLTDENGALFTL